MRTWAISALSSVCGSTVVDDGNGDERTDAVCGAANALADRRRACRASLGRDSAGRDRRRVAHVDIVVVVVVVKDFGFFPA